MVKNFEKLFLSFFLFIFLVPVAVVAPASVPLSEQTGSININPLSGNVILPGNVTYPLGTACTANSECNSGNCVDGYCCSSACTGSCNKCNVGGHLGTCTDVNSLCLGTDNSCYCSAGSCKACTGGTCTELQTCYIPGGGGGGGGGYTTVLASETATISPLSDETGIFNFTKSDTLKINSVSLTVNGTISPAQVTVSESSLPSGANAAIGVDGIVYKYLEITTNVPKGEIEEIKIDFKIEKSWFTANGVDVSSITMKRLVNGEWVSLPTVKTGEDSTYFYFEATSPGLSVFAITGLRLAVGPTTTTLPSAGATTTVPAGLTTTTTSPIIPPTQDWTWALLIVFLVALVAAFLVLRKKRKHATHQPATA